MLRRLNNLPVIPIKRSNLRGTIVGFVLGVTVSGLWANVYLLDNYNMYQSSLKSNQEHLNSSHNNYVNLKRELLEIKASLSKFDELCTKNQLMEQKENLLNIIVRLEFYIIFRMACRENIWI
jgi:hypothetical protein